MDGQKHHALGVAAVNRDKYDDVKIVVVGSSWKRELLIGTMAAVLGAIIFELMRENATTVVHLIRELIGSLAGSSF